MFMKVLFELDECMFGFLVEGHIIIMLYTLQTQKSQMLNISYNTIALCRVAHGKISKGYSWTHLCANDIMCSVYMTV
jgi:hypothetical protein